jgi:hypothetical protein
MSEMPFFYVLSKKKLTKNIYGPGIEGFVVPQISAHHCKKEFTMLSY